MYDLWLETIIQIMFFKCQNMIFLDHHVIWLNVYQPTFTKMSQIENSAAMFEVI